jgi:hypothetical protein
MRSIIFQIGLLLFFVSIVVLWLKGADIIIATLKAFIIFVASTFMMTVLVYVFNYLKGEPGEEQRGSTNGGQGAETKA